MDRKKTALFAAGISIFGAIAVQQFLKFRNTVKSMHDDDEKYW
ncbi:hypothetical protein [Metabacillus kandeliae]|nr:hypothetical protein [Metabacillus kandeliae]